MDADLLKSLIADSVVALAFLALIASLSAVSRHPSLRGAVLYAAGHFGFTAGASLFILMLQSGVAASQRPLLAWCALLASAAGCAAMVDGMARLLEHPQRRRILQAAWLGAAALLAVALVPWPRLDALKFASDLTNTAGMIGLAYVLLRKQAAPYRVPALAAGTCTAVLAPLYFGGSLQEWSGAGAVVVPRYEDWVWLDLALWHTINLCVMMLASFRALVVFVRRSRSDPLTNVLNRNGFEEEVEARRLRGRPEAPLVVLVFDIDHFKSINDRWGHAAGDAYLVRFAEVLQSCVRQSDVVARIGGEEFVAVLVDAHMDAAQRVAKNILSTVSTLNVVHEDALVNTTVSIGMAEGFGVENVEALVRRADRALYAAKAGGRNQIRIAGAGETTGTMPVLEPAGRWRGHGPPLQDELSR
jgi:diguanylate cyclase (GGDEF)-like protein